MSASRPHRFLFCPVPELGDVHPTVPLARALQARGHQVSYLTSPELEPLLRQQDLRCHVAPGGVWAGETGAPSIADQIARMPTQLKVLSRALAESQADVLVDGAFPFAPRLFAELHGIPRATLFAGNFPIPTREPIFPHGPGQPPPTDEAGRGLARLSRVIEAEREGEEISAWDALRVSLGLPALGQHPWRSDASAQLVLLPTAPEFEYPRDDLPPQFWFIGPLVWQSPLAGEVPERVRALSGRPVVFVSQGATYNRNPVILRLALQALAGEDVHVVATLLRPFEASELGAVPDNAVLERFVPLSAVLDRLALVITHAGAGTVHAALQHGVPLIALPFTADQPEVAARVVWSGAGLRLDPFDSTPEALRAAVRRVLDEPGFRDQARRIQRAYARYDAPALGAQLLERLAARRLPVCRALDDNPWSALMHGSGTA